MPLRAQTGHCLIRNLRLHIDRAAAFGLGQFLMVRMVDGTAARSLAGNEIARQLFDTAGMPTITAFVAYFGAMFATIGWWKLTDPLRCSRLRIAPILLTIVAAWLWYLVLPFPQPWGFMAIAGIAITSQLAAPWLSPAERTAALAKQTPTRHASEDD